MELRDYTFLGTTRSLCPHCRRVERPYARAVAYGSYDGGIRELIHLLKYNGVRLSRDARPLHRNAKLDRKRLVSAFRASGAAVEAFLRERLQSGKRIGFFQGKPIRWMCYLIAHDSHHRGQIALALKQNGMRLPEKVALREIWYPWFGRDF